MPIGHNSYSVLRVALKKKKSLTLNIFLHLSSAHLGKTDEILKTAAINGLVKKKKMNTNDIHRIVIEKFHDTQLCKYTKYNFKILKIRKGFYIFFSWYTIFKHFLKLKRLSI